MTSVLVVQDIASTGQTLVADLESVGVHVIGAVQRSTLVQEVARLAPDLVVAHEARLSDALLDMVAVLAATLPRPLVLFTSDPDVARMAQALEAGVHAYEVNGYGTHRLRAVLHLARARFAHEQKLRGALADVSHRFEERKLVDRAKGILMRARQVSEDEAFRVLRAASMHSNRRVGQVSQQLIAAAGRAEAVNRAGQLRMLSQQLVKLHALRAAGFALPDTLPGEAARRVDANLAELGRRLSQPTYGDLLDAVVSPWTALKSALARPPLIARLAEVDALAERVLVQAERLVSSLQTDTSMSRLQVINVSGRQRMLPQRAAKQALLAQLLDAAGGTEVSAGAAFEEGLRYLNALPLTTPEIAGALGSAAERWAELTEAAARAGSADGQRTLFEASEALTARFEQLTERYERSMQMLMG